jgi:hypothetical protein
VSARAACDQLSADRVVDLEFDLEFDLDDGQDVRAQPEFDLAQPSRLTWRHKLAALLFVVVLGVALGTGTLVHRPAPRPQPAAVPQVSSDGFLPPGTDAADSVADATGVADDASSCPAAITCVAHYTLPSGFLDAVRQRLPGASARSQFSVIETSPVTVFYRRLTASAGDVALLLIVSRLDFIQDWPSASVVRRPGLTVASASLITQDNFYVQVQLAGPASWQPDLDLMRSLAVDPRLRALQ